jgi:flagellar motility protein MotE (MotC chaperone)
MALAFVLSAGPALAEGKDEPADTPARSDAEQFCANIADTAADARFAWEARTLQDLGRTVEERTAELEAKRLELEGWVRQRQEFLAQAEASVVAIYSRMRPDAAAEQLAAMEAKAAAAVLAKLDPRAASTIFNEMDPKRAVSLAKLIGGSPEEPKDDGSS